ncbi:Cobalt transport protein [Bifidobacterium sp. DSM 109958]|uniref:Cobalt transport protein n=1 Tax=Bifidobacterium moraviense TaxID=2675323 RepID=A0A7Y0I042_9BIFI|nr:energy-coupling factor transporter transmembrane component T [Bifidobacterium sp. DSM 109958]NMN01073.1 Cobalt transport protein [Bifidobacterium sp. DSM 109958]
MREPPREARPPRDAQTLPAWLCTSERYVPLPDRSSFIGRNLGHVGALLAQVGAPVPVARNVVDRALGCVSPALRLAGIVALVVAMNLTHAMAFTYLLFALTLVMLAARPARLIAAILRPTLAVCALSLAVALPSVLIGQAATPARLTLRAFVAVSLVVALARTVAWNRLIASLRAFGCPASAAYVCDVTIQFIDVLGRSMMSLLTALRLRSVGRDRTKLTSAGRLLGAVFLRAQSQARRMGQAMVCRGFDGTYPVRRVRPSAGGIAANAAYALGVAALLAAAAYLELAAGRPLGYALG